MAVLLTVLLTLSETVAPNLWAGSNKWISSGPFVGSRVQSLAIDPHNPGTLYAGTNGGVFKSDQPRNYPLSKSTALCVNTAFAYPYYILPILFPHKKSLGLSPAIFGIMQSVMHG